MEALLRFSDTGSPALTSELMHSCPQNLGDAADPAAATRRRGLVTLSSFDLDRPGITPWFWADANGSGYNRWPPPLRITRLTLGRSDRLAFLSTDFPPTSDSDFGPDCAPAAPPDFFAASGPESLFARLSKTQYERRH